MSILKTNRLLLRPLNLDDAEIMFKNWTYDERVAKYCRWYPHKSIDETKQLLKMYLEQAIMLAKQYELKYQIIELYIAYGNYMEDFMRVTHNYSSNNLDITNDMYNKALNLARELRLNNLVDKVYREKNDFKTFCQLNSIG